MPTKHAKLSPSSAERWINCPGSARLAEKYPEEHTLFAEEGTLAHEVARILIQYNAGDLTKGEKEEQLSAQKEKIDAFYKEHKDDMTGSFEAMVKILEPYVDYVWAEYQAAKKADEAAVLMAEEEVVFDDYVPDGFGTSDVVIIGAGKATVIDLKYGVGKRVSAKNNPQIRLYALGAISEFEMLYDFDRVKLVIYQPRLDFVTEDELSVEDLKKWAKTVVKPAAIEADGDKGRIVPGPWCDSHFCPAAARCKARAAWFLKAEPYMIKDPALLTDEELGEVLPKLDSLAAYLKKVEKYVTASIVNGVPIKGWKVIEGQSKRRYSDEDKALAAVMAAGYKEELLYEPRKVLGITNMEKLLGKKKFREVLEQPGIVIKPQGTPKLAPESDPAPALVLNPTDFDDD